MRVGGEGCEVVYRLGYWGVHVHDACFIHIELHIIPAGVLLKGGKHFLQDSRRSGE